MVRGGSTGPRADANGACPFEPESWDSSSPILVYHKPTGVVIKYCTCSSFSAGTERNETKRNRTRLLDHATMPGPRAAWRTRPRRLPLTILLPTEDRQARVIPFPSTAAASRPIDHLSCSCLDTKYKKKNIEGPLLCCARELVEIPTPPHRVMKQAMSTRVSPACRALVLCCVRVRAVHPPLLNPHSISSPTNPLLLV